MDWKEASPTAATGANSARRWSAMALDRLAPLCAPVAARWDAEAQRRAELRTEEHLKALLKAQRAHSAARTQAASARTQNRLAKSQSRVWWSSVRRSARAADRAASKQAAEAKAKLKAARAEYPDTLLRAAVRAHAVHAVPAGIGSYVLSTAQDWTVWPAWVSAALIGANVVAVRAGRRRPVAVETDGATAEERRLMERLDPAYWAANAESRGLAGTLTSPPELTDAGIVCGVRLDGKWSAKDLASKADAVRALLGMKTETRMQISRGSHGDRALIVIRTRSASDGISMLWTPEHVGIGVDETTGEFVDVPMAGTHKLIAGVTNMGKSVSWRPWMMQAVADPLWAGILLDPKRLEARQWAGKIRTEGHQRGSNEEIRQRIYDTVCELVAEMYHRQEIADVTQWDPTEEYPNLLVVIEEGRQILQMAKDPRWSDILDMIDDLYTLARATGVWIIWATQYPSRTNGGVTAMVSENSLTVMSLTVDSPVSDRVIYGENASDSGWEPSKLEGIPGRALVKHKNRKPDPVRIWYVTDSVVSALPDVEPWTSRAKSSEVPAERPALRLVKETDTKNTAPAAEVPAPREESTTTADGPPVTNRSRVLAAIRDGATTPKAVAEVTGINKGTVSRELKRLTEAGAVRRADDGALVAGEVSA